MGRHRCKDIPSVKSVAYMVKEVFSICEMIDLFVLKEFNDEVGNTIFLFEDKRLGEQPASPIAEP